MSYYTWGLIAVVVGLIAYSSYTPPAKALPTATPTEVKAVPVQTVSVDTSAQLDSCIEQANDSYTQSWQNNCTNEYNSCISGGISQSQCYSWYGGMCSLGNTVAAQLNTNLQRDKLGCYRQY